MTESNPPFKRLTEAVPHNGVSYDVGKHFVLLNFAEAVIRPENVLVNDLGDGLIQVIVNVTGTFQSKEVKS